MLRVLTKTFAKKATQPNPGQRVVATDLPDEVWIKVFSHLSRRRIAHVALTCHRFLHIVRNDMLWKTLLKSHFGPPVRLGAADTWLEAYQLRLAQEVRLSWYDPVLRSLILFEIPHWAEAIHQGDDEYCFEAVKRFRRLVTETSPPPLEDVVLSGMVKDIIPLLQRHDHPALQLEVAWTLASIAGGELHHRLVIAEAGGIRALVQALSLRDEAVVAQTLWALGNLVHDNAVLRDAVLEENAMADILTVYKAMSDKTSLYRHLAWALRNLCAGSVDKSVYSFLTHTLSQNRY